MTDYEIEFVHVKQALTNRYRSQKTVLYWLGRGPKISSQDQIDAVEEELKFLANLLVCMEEVK